MSIENGERFMRALKSDESLRKKVRAAGSDGFLVVSAEAGASCSAYDVVAALLREIEGKETLADWER
ncbi:MAG: Nif11-like leader peptide family natural product precursor [Gammaproteobacteria bacterium]|nr:Nif11-like leader peptide family natural product precursor [Gammaproteobacteria bacterium]MDE0364339.1 Nif11-like leader peptide family natural product precursor [Gammaproteobacteria bacterium]